MEVQIGSGITFDVARGSAECLDTMLNPLECASIADAVERREIAQSLMDTIGLDYERAWYAAGTIQKTRRWKSHADIIFDSLFDELEDTVDEVNGCKVVSSKPTDAWAYNADAVDEYVYTCHYRDDIFFVRYPNGSGWFFNSEGVQGSFNTDEAYRRIIEERPPWLRHGPHA